MDGEHSLVTKVVMHLSDELIVLRDIYDELVPSFRMMTP
jgi:hypothetical protein